MTIIAKVRKAGSIGIFYDKEFEVENEAQNWKDEWFKKFGEEYELDHFVDSIQCFYVE